MNRKNVLIAEDDVDDYDFFVEAFETISPGYTIARVKNGLECITYLKTQPKPDMIFLDLNIPYKNGLECLSFIKDSEALTGIPVVIYSTSHYIKQIDAAFKNGANYYIVKPGDINILAEILAIVSARLNESLEQPCKQNFVVRNMLPSEY